MSFSAKVLIKMQHFDFKWKKLIQIRLDIFFKNYSIKLIFVFKISNQFRRQFER
jgi:hypothetical protein